MIDGVASAHRRARRRRRAALVALVVCSRCVRASRSATPPRQPAPAHLRARPPVAHRRRGVVLLPARHAARRAPGAQRQLARARSSATCGRSLFVVLVLIGRDGGDARHGAAADRGLRRRRVRRGVDRDVVAPALWRGVARRSRWRSRCSSRGSSATTLALFELGAIDDVTAGRLENLAAPLASANDQLALVDVVPERGAARGLRPRQRAVVRLRGGATAAPACRRRSRATTRSPRWSARSAGRPRGR